MGNWVKCFIWEHHREMKRREAFRMASQMFSSTQKMVIHGHMDEIKP
jgi:hypothetical protein